MGIDGADIYANRGRWKMRRLSSIMAELGHTGVCNYCHVSSTYILTDFDGILLNSSTTLYLCRPVEACKAQWA